MWQGCNILPMVVTTRRSYTKGLSQAHFPPLLFFFPACSSVIVIRDFISFQIDSPETAQHGIILFQAFFSLSSCVKSPRPGRWESAFHMLATQDYCGNESVITHSFIALLILKYNTIIIIISCSSSADLHRTILCSCPQNRSTSCVALLQSIFLFLISVSNPNSC